jgi:hypothetical protein
MGSCCACCEQLVGHDPPPTFPVKEALTTAVKRYLSLRSGGTLVNEKKAKERVLMALAPLAMRGIENLTKRGGASHDSVDIQSWDFLRDSSENFVIKEVWGGWETDTGHDMSLDKGVHSPSVCCAVGGIWLHGHPRLFQP